MRDVWGWVVRLPLQPYRIVRAVVDGGDGEGPPVYSYTIREVHHGDAGEVLGYSEETIPYGVTRAALQEDLLRMLNALIYPVLDEDCEVVVD